MTYITYLEREDVELSQQHDEEDNKRRKFETAKSGSANATRLPNRGCG